jgi:serine phosphatase RsbU (regulator of sigma subunit)
MNPASEPTSAVTMQCMEIRGGNHAVENTVVTPGLDAWVFSRPFEGAASGGDVYYVSLCGGGLITRLIVADVSGHGAVVADFSHALRGLVRRFINHKSQASLVHSLNKQFTELAQLRRFATAVVATYLAHRDTLEVCNAGHPRPLWYRADTRQWSVLSHESQPSGPGTANLPLGLDDESKYDQSLVSLSPGDILLFYTDALTEARNAQGDLIGENGLLEIVQGLSLDDPRELGMALLTALDRYRNGAPPDDDITLIVARHNAGPARHPSLGEKLNVYAKVFGLKRV